jgi:alkanesulfonate monooxygenase SsuD/methylene tetrahydromethanopterin reductase-like flavin-dependent oxidoreductase (luciferase family)
MLKGVRGVRVGLYFDLRNPQRWRQDPASLHAFTLELCEEADRLGIDSLWFTEHHKFDDGYLSQPLTFAAAVAARTHRARLGTAVLVAPLHHPARLAEEAALVDLISNGRLDIGLGAGYRKPEYDLYRASMERRYAQTDAQVGALRALWADGGVTPQPVQDPVPLWLGYLGPQGAGRAGRLGTGLLTANAEMWPHYRAALVEAGHDPSEGRMAGGIQGWVSDDPERDWGFVAEHLEYQVNSYRRHMVEGTDQPVPRPVDVEKLRGREPRTSIDYFYLETPEGMADRVRAYTAGAPVETVFFWASIGGMSQERARDEVQLVCNKLAPLLAEHSAGPEDDQ